MTEMRNTNLGVAHSDLSVVDDLVGEAGDDSTRLVLEAARTAWLSAAETHPNDDLRAFMAGAAQSTHPGSLRARKRWSTPMFDTLANLWPPYGRVAFGTALAVVVTAVAAAGLGLGGRDSDQLGSAANGSTSTSNTSVSAPTTSTTDTIPPTAVSDLPSARITVADAGTADVAVVERAPGPRCGRSRPGWRVVHETPDEPHEIDLSYRQGDDRVDLDIELDDGRIRVRIRDRRTETETESNLGTTNHATATSNRNTPWSAEDREDNSGPGNAEDREHNSGPGNAEDREHNSGPGNAEDREDNSGPGNAEDREHNSGPGNAEGY